MEIRLYSLCIFWTMTTCCIQSVTRIERDIRRMMKKDEQLQTSLLDRQANLSPSRVKRNLSWFNQLFYYTRIPHERARLRRTSMFYKSRANIIWNSTVCISVVLVLLTIPVWITFAVSAVLTLAKSNKHNPASNTAYLSCSCCKLLCLILLLSGRLFDRVDLIKPSVRPQNVSSVLMKFVMHVEVDEWCTTVCSMTRSKVKVKVTSASKLEIRPFSKAISSAIYNGSWQPTTDS